MAGLLLRYLFRDHFTLDAVVFLIPWYRFAHEHGLASLGTAFTNYTPFYSYLLILATQFDGFAKPLLLIKSISFVFEFGAAVLAYQLVYFATKSAKRSTMAFAASWLAPTVLFNGALWGQCDSIWAFFELLCVYLYCRGRQGILPFAISFAVKAQGIFLAPFVLGMVFRRRRQWLWLASVPAVYLALAVPVVIAGGSLRQVATVYLNQADTYHRLSMNAANLWIFVPHAFYTPGVVLGLLLAGGAALVIAVGLARSERSSPEALLLGACISLLLMPYLLPKMHERYFYAFELASLSLACINVRYAAAAVLAQVDGILAYLPFDRGWNVHFDLVVAALCNTVLVLYFLRQSGSEERATPFPIAHFVRYTLLCVGFAALLVHIGYQPAALATTILGLAFCVLLPTQAYVMLGRTTVQQT
jgi:Gpi18-like mannosyltransferase